MKLEKILVPVDLSERSPEAVELALFYAAKFGASLDLVYVWQPPTYVAPDVMVDLPGWNMVSLENYARTSAGRDLEELVARVKPPENVKVRSRIVVGRPADQILSIAEREGMDLIVIATQARNALSRALLGSVAREVATHATCPVLTVRHVRATAPAAEPQG